MLLPHPLLPVVVCCLVAVVGRAAESGARTATPDEISLLNASLHRVADDLPRWAYTEHRVIRDTKGRVKSEQVVRYDPSKPYAEQWTPLQIDGRAPTAREQAKFRRRGEAADPERPASGRRRWPSLGEVLDVGRSMIARETAAHWEFEIPLIKVGNERFPPEKFQVRARVAKPAGQLENIAVLLRESFRSKLVVKVKAGEASLDFAAVDARFPPTLVGVSGDVDWSILFFGGGGSLELKRTDVKHVRLYDERFEVQIGTLKAIDF